MEETQSESFESVPQDPTAVSNEKCPGCGDNMRFDPETGSLKCPSCGSVKQILSQAGQEIAFSALSGVKSGWQNETHVYRCANCNAEEALAKREIAHICPFCGSPSVVEQEEIDCLRPNALLPFTLGKEKAAEKAVGWAKKKLFAPSAFKRFFRPENINGVYLPAFTFDAKTRSEYQGKLGEYYYVTVKENGKNVSKQRTRYFYVSGNYDDFFDDLAVNATDAVPKSVMKTLMHYDYHNCVTYEDDFLYGFSALLYTKSGETCWQEARAQAERVLRNRILAQYNYDEISYLNVSTSYSNVTFKYMLLPMYTGSYSYVGKTYSFYVNGRSGKVKGKAPISPVKVTIASLIVAAVAAGIAFLYYFLTH